MMLGQDSAFHYFFKIYCYSSRWVGYLDPHNYLSVELFHDYLIILSYVFLKRVATFANAHMFCASQDGP